MVMTSSTFSSRAEESAAMERPRRPTCGRSARRFTRRWRDAALRPARGRSPSCRRSSTRTRPSPGTRARSPWLSRVSAPRAVHPAIRVGRGAVVRPGTAAPVAGHRRMVRGVHPDDDPLLAVRMARSCWSARAQSARPRWWPPSRAPVEERARTMASRCIHGVARSGLHGRRHPALLGFRRPAVLPGDAPVLLQRGRALPGGLERAYRRPLASSG